MTAARYACQVALPDLGEAGQRRVVAGVACVLVGARTDAAAWALTYLAAGGLGRVELAAEAGESLDELVSSTEATGHVLLRAADAGAPRGEAFARRLRDLNPDMVVALVTTPMRPPLPLPLLAPGDNPLAAGAAAAAGALLAAAREAP